ncbi:hypothetical protein DPMN_009426 [Dreissena polymorpha]|uniref:Uncharacterized protein n=1 Tax=Dreissena polymorpha TaxID=45954 RepID=A0A9D4S043_DREPO|nr:hypothetical protein DPMN_009426 [Dreissena polymorpha]
MRHVRRLRKTPFSVDYDFPRNTQEVRNRLWPIFKEPKYREPRSKLIQDGTIIRLAQLDHIIQIKTHHPRMQELYQPSAERNVSKLGSSQIFQTHSIELLETPFRIQHNQTTSIFIVQDPRYFTFHVSETAVYTTKRNAN